jgi:ribosomal protein S18 acetylase RimI-like enzyme
MSARDEITPGRMESVESDSWADYLLAGNRVLGTRALRAGGGLALEVPSDPSGSLNRVSGIGWEEPVNAALLTRIIGFYREAGAPGAILMIAPPVLPPDWAALAERFGIVGTGSAIVKLSGEARAVADQSKAARPLDRGLRLGPVPASRAAEWGQAMRLGFGDDDPRRAQQAAGLYGLPGWQLFAVYEDDDIVATGSLRVDGAVGHLFGGATLPSARNRGAQSALIAARAAAATEAGCEWVIAEAMAENPGQHNPSLHNQLRAGLTVRYQRENQIWRDSPA